MNVDIAGIILEEISLEGLDGITLDSLWVRLGAVTNFPLNVEEPAVQSYLWSSVILQKVKNDDVKLFELPQARQTILLYNRYEHINPESGSCVDDPSVELRDVYDGVYPVTDGKIRGSCKFYKERKDITQHVLQKRFSIEQVLSAYGQKLVIVAAQAHRERVLQLSQVDPCLELNQMQYAVLERIGRTRYLGEATVGREATQYKDTPKTLFYLRKVLIKKGLIKKQQFVLYDSKSGQNRHGLVLMLTRFFILRLTPVALVAKRVSDQLLQEPNNESDYFQLRDKLEIRNKTYRHMFPNYVKYFKIYEVDEEDESGKQVVRRRVKLIKPIECEEDDDQEPDSDDDDEECTGSYKTSGDLSKLGKIFDPARIMADRSMLCQTLHVIEGHLSEDGISLREIGEQLMLPKLEVRALVRVLERLKEVSPIRVEHGRQKVTKYLPRNRVGDAQKQFDAERKSLSYDVKDTITFLRRANLILEIVKEKKIVDQLFTFKKAILEAEKDTPYTVDQKSIRRIILKLALQGHVRSIKTVLTCKNRTVNVHIVCDPSITANSPLIREKIEQMKFRYFGTSDDDLPMETKRKKKKSIEEVKPEPVDEQLVLVYQPSMGRRYGLQPKMQKILSLYRLLFHVLYERQNSREQYDDWRRFIQAIPQGNNGNVKSYALPELFSFSENGVCLLGDIVPRIPLSIFVKIIFITYVIPELEEYLNDPIKKHHTLSMLPPLLRKKLMFKRKFIFNLVEELTSLTYLKLVDISYKDLQPKETMIIKLHTRVTLEDERTINEYTFERMSDVDEYIYDLTVHCSRECSSCTLDKRLFAHNPKNWKYAATTKVKPGVVRTLSEKPNRSKSSGSKLQTTDGTVIKKRSRVPKRKLPCEFRENSDGKRSAVEGEAETPKVQKVRHKEIQQRLRQPFYDTVDLNALKLMKKNRCEWSKEEDSFLLMCRVASVLLDPACTNKVCVHGRVIRDELHRNFPEIAKDKTAKACQRRIVYMLKKEQTRQNVQDWVLECKQDLETLDVQKPTVPKTHTEIWKEAYLNLLYRLLTKFQAYHLSDSHENEDLIFDSFEEITAHYNIVESCTHLLPEKPVLHKDPQNVVDIYVHVVSNVLLSSVLNNASVYNHPSFAHTLFKIYQGYPDVLIRSVITKLQKNGVMTKVKKGSNIVAVKTRGGTPFKITNHYMFLLKTRLSVDTLVCCLNDDLKILDGQSRIDAALITSLFSSRNATFNIEIPEVFVNFDETLSFRSFNRRGQLEPAFHPRSSSRSALYMLRQRLTANPAQSSLQEFLVLNPCLVTVKPKKPIAINLKSFNDKVQKFKEYTEPGKHKTGSGVNTKLCNFLKSKKEVGATASEITEFNSGVFPEQQVTKLVESKYVYRVGVTKFRWIDSEHIKPWLVNSVVYPYPDSCKPTSNPRPVNFLGKAWRSASGDLSEQALFKFLSAILGHIMLNPGVSEMNLCSHFRVCLDPVQIFEIVELLMAANCITKIALESVNKQTLFESDADNQKITLVFYESTPEALIHLGRIKKELGIKDE